MQAVSNSCWLRGIYGRLPQRSAVAGFPLAAQVAKASTRGSPTVSKVVKAYHWTATVSGVVWGETRQDAEQSIASLFKGLADAVEGEPSENEVTWFALVRDWHARLLDRAPEEDSVLHDT